MVWDVHGTAAPPVLWKTVSTNYKDTKSVSFMCRCQHGVLMKKECCSLTKYDGCGSFCCASFWQNALQSFCPYLLLSKFPSPSIYPSIHLSVRQSVRPSIRPSVRPSLPRLFHPHFPTPPPASVSQIDVDNPCIIMSQDKSREFLHVGTPADKFRVRTTACVAGHAVMNTSMVAQTCSPFMDLTWSTDGDALHC